MAQYRQSGFDRLAGRGHDVPYGNGTSSSDHVAIGVRNSHKQSHRARRPGQKSGCGAGRKISVCTVAVVLSLAITALVYVYISGDYKEVNSRDSILDDDFKRDFLSNVSRINMSEVQFGGGSGAHGRDSRYWDGDDRRRDDDYNEEDVLDKSHKDKPASEGKTFSKISSGSVRRSIDRHGLYNEAGRNELKMYEEKYEASLRDGGLKGAKNKNGNQFPGKGKPDRDKEGIDVDDEYDDGIDLPDARADEYDDNRHDASETGESRDLYHDGSIRNMMEEVEEASTRASQNESMSSHGSDNLKEKSKHANNGDGHLTKSTGRKRKRRKFSSSCHLKFLDSAAQLVEPLESRKFVRFSLQYTNAEHKPDGENWEPRFAGRQSLREREESFIARDQTINCGFVKGPSGYPSTGFDLAEDDSRYISKCHIAVVSCIFGNSDHLRSPTGKTVSRVSKKNVCFVMFVDEITLQTLTSEGQMPDRMGFIGMWRIVVVKNLPYADMRRVGKVPKLLAHRLFPSARYSIWLDSKLRLQRDPLLILEYFLWRKGHEYAISNHYDRHCVWEEVAQNKRLNKYNHTIIDQQFAFYQADGLKRFNASDSHKLLPSNVPEGSFIIRAHTPMSNLFSCLWFNEVDRFTPRDQLSFAYTYQKLRKKNPEKPFYLNMFKDCERRMIAKLYHHRSEEKHEAIIQEATE